MRNQDPIAEQGGLNLYGFCGNNGVNRWDYLGNIFISPETTPAAAARRYLADPENMDYVGASFSDGIVNTGINSGIGVRGIAQQAMDNMARSGSDIFGTNIVTTDGRRVTTSVTIRPFEVLPDASNNTGHTGESIAAEQRRLDPLGTLAARDAARAIRNDPTNAQAWGDLLVAGMSSPGVSAGGITVKVETSVLGNYPKYIRTANELGANRFSIPAKIWSRMTEAEKWAANQKFLDRMIARGDTIVLTRPFNEIDKGTTLWREIQYLVEKGFKPNNGGNSLLPPPKG